MKTKVLVTGALHPKATQALLGDESYVVTYEPDCSRARLLELVKDAQVLISRSETNVDEELILAAHDLKVIARAAVGVGNIDIPFATDRGILVINTPGKNTNSAAELSVGLMLCMLRNLPQAHHHVKQGGWDRHKFSGFEMKGKRLGIVGLGHVGHRVAKFAHGFDMEVFAYDPYIAPNVFERHLVVQVKSMEELASKVDILSFHVPLTKETKGMLNYDLMMKMRKGSYIVNAARGGVAIEADMLTALNNEQLAGVAIDTWEGEPRPLEALVSHNKVWCSPHIGASTEEAQLAIGETIVLQVKKAVDGGVVDYPVNLPQIGVIENPILKPYAVLSEKLGSLAAQLIDFNPASVSLSYRGDLAGMDQSLVRLGFMKGYVNHVVDGFVSYVNAQTHFERLGIPITESQDPGFQSFRSALKVIFHGVDGKTLAVGGIVFDEKYPRISLINDHYFEIDPSGSFVVIENMDRPGVVGHLGTFLANHNINIDSFELSRNRVGGTAMSLIKVDTAPSSQQIKEMSLIENVISVKSLKL